MLRLSQHASLLLPQQCYYSIIKIGKKEYERS
jgi:hypothetical protein